MFYLHTTLKRKAKEITKRVYQVQKNSPLEGDWLTLVEGDFKTLRLELNETLIQKCTKSQFKVMVKRSQ